ncbi:ABC transporter ATP-binding protein, partial [Vallitalea guaymasensis]|uniref:ABC transporter ATP-binding protein n=1 Tax=Vallitalea guaymasensis TaxID=1185412 RepID=UPI00272DBB0B
MGLTAIALNEFCYRYNNVKKLGLDTINLKINEGECILVTGRSGCGKTTLTRAINALIPHFYEGQISGKAYVYDIDVGNEPIHNVSKKVGSVFQDPRSQFFTTNTTSEIAFGMENLGYEREHMNDSIKIVSEYLGIEDLLNRSVHELSSGEKQKIAIASIYAMNPSIIVFDEPSANLDIESIVKLRGVMKVLKEKGHTIIIVEHRIHYLLGLVDRILYMDKGKIIED